MVALVLKAIEPDYGACFVKAHVLMEDLKKASAEERLRRRRKVYLAPRLPIGCRDAVLKRPQECRLKSSQLWQRAR